MWSTRQSSLHSQIEFAHFVQHWKHRENEHQHHRVDPTQDHPTFEQRRLLRRGRVGYAFHQTRIATMTRNTAKLFCSVGPDKLCAIFAPNHAPMKSPSAI